MFFVFSTPSYHLYLHLCTSGIAFALRDKQMVLFSDSTGDSGRRLNAPASFSFEDIGAFPWRKLFSSNDTDVSLNEETCCIVVPSRSEGTIFHDVHG